MNKEMKAIDLNERCAAPEDDDCYMERLEVEFAMPVYMSQDQQLRLVAVLEEIIRDPKNTPKEGVHWLSSVGSKPNFSRIDCALLGVEPGPNPPADGEEPQHDDSIAHFASSARSFNSDKERARELARRGPG